MFENAFGSYKNVECGLVCIIQPPASKKYYEEPKTIPIPLLSVDIQANIVAAVAQVQLTQVYVNKESNPIEAIYYFPVDSNGSVTAFIAELEGKKIQGIVKPEKEAKAQYDEAVKAQKSAFLVESDKPDIFKVRVGFLKPGATVKINITYVTEVKNEKGTDGLRFFIPTTVSPRYIPPTAATDKKTKSLKNMTFSAESPAPLSIKVNVCLQGEIKKIESPSHGIKITSKGQIVGKKGWSSAIVVREGKTTDMDRDFVLNIIPKEVHVPRLYQEQLENSTVIMAHLIPSFNLDEQKVELLFVLDRSGSMEGQSIGLAKKALQLFLHSLPMDCYFNIIGFGWSFKFLFPSSVKYDDGTLQKALSHAKSLKADLGGTEILKPLKEIYNRPYIPGYLRQIFVLTDGEVGNTEQVIGFIKANAHSSRVFSLGIGDGASHALVEGLADAGGGTSIFASENESINAKILQQLKNALQPSLTEVRIEWKGIPQAEAPTAAASEPAPAPAPVEINRKLTLRGYDKPIITEPPTPTIKKIPAAAPVAKFIQVPDKVPPIYDGSQLLVFGIFPKSGQTPTGVTITGDSPDGPLSIHIPLDNAAAECDVSATGAELLHKLAVIKTIAELQMKIAAIEYAAGGAKVKDSKAKSGLKKQIIDLSVKHNIISNYTSFLAIDSESQGASSSNDSCWVMQTKHIPSQVTHGWHGGYLAMGAARKSTGSGYLCASAPRKSAPATGGVRAPKRMRAAFSTKRRSTATGACGSKSKTVESESDDDDDDDEEEESSDDDEQGNGVATDPMEAALHKLISTQSFNGSFKLNEAFATALGFKLEILKKAAKTHGWLESIYATALALAYLQDKFQQLKDDWELIGLKANKWLGKNAGAKLKIETVMKTATAFVKAQHV